MEIDTPGLSGVTKRRIGAGTRVLARVIVYCDTEGDGDTIEAHRVTASATTEAQLSAPRLVKVEAMTNSFCGFIPDRRQQRFQPRLGKAWRSTTRWSSTSSRCWEPIAESPQGFASNRSSPAEGESAFASVR